MSVRHIPVFCPEAIILVSREVKFTWIFAGGHPNEGVKVKRLPVAGENLTNSQPYLGNGAR